VPLTQQSALTILMGMNRHGLPALVSLATAIAGTGLTATGVMALGWGVVGVAAGVSAALTTASFFVGWYACRTLAISPTDYFRRAVLEPIAHTVPFAVCLGAIRILWADHLLLTALATAVAGLTTLAPVYWMRALPLAVRRSILSRLGVANSAGEEGDTSRRLAADLQRGLP
jgi:hypothetical protein